MSQQEWRDGVGKIKPFLTANDIFSLEAPEPSPWRERSAHEIVQEKDFQGILISKPEKGWGGPRERTVRNQFMPGQEGEQS